jgi:hypothetical protein
VQSVESLKGFDKIITFKTNGSTINTRHEIKILNGIGV